MIQLKPLIARAHVAAHIALCHAIDHLMLLAKQMEPHAEWMDLAPDDDDEPEVGGGGPVKAAEPAAKAPGRPASVCWWQSIGGLCVAHNGGWLLIASEGMVPPPDTGPMPLDVAIHLLHGEVAERHADGSWTLRPQLDDVTPAVELCDA